MKKIIFALIAVAAVAAITLTSCKQKQYENAQLKFINQSDRYVAIIVTSSSEDPSLDKATCVAQLHPNQTVEANERINIKDLHVFICAAAEGVTPEENGNITYTELLDDKALNEYYGYDVVTFTVYSDLSTGIKCSSSSSSSNFL